MYKRIGLLAALILIVAPAFAQKVYIDYDKDADFDSYQTFAWAKAEESTLEQSDPFTHSYIKNAVEFHLNESMTQVDSDPDLWVTYHTDSKSEVRFNTSNMGYGYGGGWGGYGRYGYGGGVSSSTTTSSTYEVGTLIVDIWDAEKKEMIFRGVSETTIPSNPKKGQKKIEKSVTKMSKQFQKMRAKDQ